MVANNDKFISILEEEMVLALGCTEPIAIAYASAYARKVLNTMPTRVEARCSGNIYKNVKSVIVPNTGNLCGIKASVIAGIVSGNADLGLQVLTQTKDGDIAKIKALLDNKEYCSINLLETSHTLHVIVTVYDNDNYVVVEIRNLHDNIVRVEHNGKLLIDNRDVVAPVGNFTDRSILNFKSIYEFANTVEIADIKQLMDRQIEHNYAIAIEGMTGKYGVGIGVSILKNSSAKDVYDQMRAFTSAASEARMSGCVLPVVTNSGSGNQGIATSVPIIIYAKHSNITGERLYRALVFANLLTIYQKVSIGRLSAFCGAVSATCASIAALAYLNNRSEMEIKMVIQNTLASDIGIICDGAKASCGAKIASGLDTALRGYFLALDHKCYNAEDGILKSSVDDTIASVGQMASKGMIETDKEILKIMMGI